MRNINTYITEKFRISKNSIASSASNYKLPDVAYDKINHTIFDSTFRRAGYSEYACQELAKSINSKDNCIKFWLATQYLTKSIPYKYKNTIYSFPGNYGYPFIDKLVSEFNFNEDDIDNLLSIYKYGLGYKEVKFPQLLKDHYNSNIESIINSTKYKGVLDYELIFYDDINDYSKTTKEIFEKNTGSVIIPFYLIYGNERFKCEVINRGNSVYFNYKFERDDYRLNSKFLKRIEEEIKKRS